MTDGDELLKLRIHFASGKTVDTLVGDIVEDVDVEDYVTAQLYGPLKTSTGYISVPEGKPRWTWIGDVYLYSQAVEGVEVL